MDINATLEDQIAIVRLTGYLDTKSSPDFERSMLEKLKEGAKACALDFTKLDMITSSGIRVLMMTTKRLGAGRVALWGVNEQVKVVLSISGLTAMFQVFDSKQAAVDRLKKAVAPQDAAPVEASKMTRLINRLLGDSGQTPAPRSSTAPSKMTEHVSELLKRTKP